MGSFSIWHWLVVLAIVLLLFGRGRLSDIMGEFAKGIKSFKKGMADDDSQQRQLAEPAVTPPPPPAAVPHPHTDQRNV